MSDFKAPQTEEDAARIKECYDEVFDSTQHVKVCGREACSNLISVLEQVTGVKGHFGDVDSGTMFVNSILIYINENFDLSA